MSTPTPGSCAVGPAARITVTVMPAGAQASQSLEVCVPCVHLATTSLLDLVRHCNTAAGRLLWPSVATSQKLASDTLFQNPVVVFDGQEIAASVDALRSTFLASVFSVPPWQDAAAAGGASDSSAQSVFAIQVLSRDSDCTIHDALNIHADLFKDYKLPLPSPSSEFVMTMADRDIKITSPSGTSKTYLQDASESAPNDVDNDLTPEELKNLMLQSKKYYEETINPPLLTRKMREEKRLELEKRYPKGRIRIRFQDNFQIDFIVLSNEPVSVITDVLEEVLVRIPKTTRLYTALPIEKPLPTSGTVRQARLIPTALIHCSFSQPKKDENVGSSSAKYGGNLLSSNPPASPKPAVGTISSSTSTLSAKDSAKSGSSEVNTAEEIISSTRDLIKPELLPSISTPSSATSGNNLKSKLSSMLSSKSSPKSGDQPIVGSSDASLNAEDTDKKANDGIDKKKISSWLKKLGKK